MFNLFYDLIFFSAALSSGHFDPLPACMYSLTSQVMQLLLLNYLKNVFLNLGMFRSIIK